jgi:hypothetical protein
MVLSLHYNGDITDKQLRRSLLLLTTDWWPCSIHITADLRFSHALSHRLRNVLGFPPVIRTMAGSLEGKRGLHLVH